MNYDKSAFIIFVNEDFASETVYAYYSAMYRFVDFQNFQVFRWFSCFHKSMLFLRNMFPV